MRKRTITRLYFLQYFLTPPPNRLANLHILLYSIICVFIKNAYTIWYTDDADLVGGVNMKSIYCYMQDGIALGKGELERRYAVIKLLEYLMPKGNGK